MCTTDSEQEKYATDQIKESWTTHYDERMRVLNVPDSQKDDKLKIYFNTFQCLNRECGVQLVSQVKFKLYHYKYFFSVF